MKEFFREPSNPTMNELVHYIQVNFSILANDMKASNHNAAADEPNPYHIEDTVWTHTMMVCLRAENDNSNKITSICALLHDIGKPEARDIIPFENKKPIHTESNEIRNDGKNDGKPSGLQREVPKSGLKTHFRGHEGLSFYRAIEIVNALEKEGVLNLEEKIEVLTIVSLHGTLFDSIDTDGNMRKENKVFDKFEKSVAGGETFKNFVQQVKNDSTGRFFTSKDGRKSNAFKLGSEIFTHSQFAAYCLDSGYPDNLPTKSENAPKITLLVGPPAAGKSSWRDANQGNAVVVCRDDIMLQYAKDSNFTVDGRPMNYTEIWQHLEKIDEHKAVDKLEQELFKQAVKDKSDIIMDRTNMSRKSRRKWLSNVPKDYNKEAVVFATVYEDILSRNKKRALETGKNISNKLIGIMMRQFMVPMYDEVDIVEWVF